MVVLSDGPLMAFISARCWELTRGRTSGWRMVVKQRYCQTNHWPIEGPACLAHNGPKLHSQKLVSSLSV